MPAVATLDQIQPVFDIANPPELGPKGRPNTLTINDIDRHLSGLSDPRTPEMRDLLRAGLYLWHDHLDESHTISQGIENRDGSLVHAIMHRREPDYGNSKYWWRRVGEHSCFAALLASAKDSLGSTNLPLEVARLISGARWDPFAFVDACEGAARDRDPALADACKRLQALEFRSFFETLLR